MSIEVKGGLLSWSIERPPNHTNAPKVFRLECIIIGEKNLTELIDDYKEGDIIKLIVTKKRKFKTGINQKLSNDRGA